MARNRSSVAAARAFTLVEMMVVVAVILVLLGILMPGIERAIDNSMTAVCQSNNRQFLIGYLTYATEHRGAIPNGFPGGGYPQDVDDNSFTPTDCFVKAENTAITDKATRERMAYKAIEQGALYPYLRDVKIWQCPAAAADANKRTYVIIDTLRGSEILKPGTKMFSAGTDRMTRIYNPGQQLVFMEESDSRGFNMGSWVLNAWDQGAGSFGVGYEFVDYVGLYHAGETADDMGFLDGHVERWQWQDPDTIKQAKNDDFFFTDPGNEDFKRLRSVYRQLATYSDAAGTISYKPLYIQ
jgi:prepilin-type N-terminal cleavage/methylation domain-containing protein